MMASHEKGGLNASCPEDLNQKICRTKGIRIRFLKKVCQLVMMMASPKHPQSDTGFESARIKVIRVKNDMNTITAQTASWYLNRKMRDKFRSCQDDGQHQCEWFQETEIESIEIICKLIGRSEWIHTLHKATENEYNSENQPGNK